MRIRFSKKTAAAAAALIMLLGAGACALYWHICTPASPSYDARIPILMYHDIAVDNAVTDTQDVTDTMTVTASRMESDLKWLSDNGYTAVLPRELAGGMTLPEKPVMITFDDGYRSNYEILYPLLKKYSMKAAISVVAVCIDEGNKRSLTWDMCREMSDSGIVEIDSHTYNMHNPSTGGCYCSTGANGIQKISGENIIRYRMRVLSDIKKSFDRISDETGSRPAMLAYPYGIAEPAALKYIHHLFPVTVTTVPQQADLKNGLYELPRYAVNMQKTPQELLAPAASASASQS